MDGLDAQFLIKIVETGFREDEKRLNQGEARLRKLEAFLRLPWYKRIFRSFVS